MDGAVYKFFATAPLDRVASLLDHVCKSTPLPPNFNGRAQDARDRDELCAPVTSP